MRYLIWSNEHSAWWRGSRSGYTVEIAAAGRYEKQEAIDICRYAHDSWRPGRPPPEIPVVEDDALDCLFGVKPQGDAKP